MTPLEVALSFGFLGGAIVALGLGALAYWLKGQLDAFHDRSSDAAEQRGYAVARIEAAIAMAARATDGTSIVRAMLEFERRQADRATDSRVATERRAKIVRLRAARARSRSDLLGVRGRAARIRRGSW